MLLDWSKSLYLNYTHVNIMDRIEEIFMALGNVERIQGEVFVCKENSDCLELGELPSNEVVNYLDALIYFRRLSIRFFVICRR